ncbi:AhpC/TSA family protein [Babesia bovis T2Bo]|uniref:thioredoxin-dependent peroxiredoxin n=1 Tax=Babesia bovis TaxID=5865 RepID=A7AQR0_BABBO|nr:AhpC/TSA family protein [Babesia bovis T2Bo]EDO06879.1 AhpC/TSA family protein [Babesia bovis T2Bo]BAN65859.1 conserved hypothetical protein [Babesia bovis]|eukprot:XP_001610447.1 hypothetical protein [Babesia bovis T2Bo]
MTLWIHSLFFLSSITAVPSRRLGHAIAPFYTGFLKPQGASKTDTMIGTTIPDNVLEAKLLTDGNEETSLRRILNNLPTDYKGIVMFLFPAVNTPLCTKQACKFSASSSSLKDLGYEVYGLTGSEVKSAKAWTTKHNLQYKVLFDPKWSLVKYLECTWLHFFINRSHVVISNDGRILALERGVDANNSADRVLEIVKSLNTTA